MTEKKRYKATPKDWAKAIIAIALYIAFLNWVDAWWGVIVIPFIFDAYVTRRIPWTWWKDAENPIVREKYLGRDFVLRKREFQI